MEETTHIEGLPEDVARYYTGAIRVLRAGVPDAAAVQLRRTIEAAAAAVEISTSPLVRAIETMIEQGLVTTSFAPALGHVRLVGNVGAHAGDRDVSQDEAEHALSFTTQLLRNLFEIPAQLSALGQASSD